MHYQSAAIKRFESENFGTETKPLYFEIQIQYHFNDYTVTILTDTPDGPKGVHAFYATADELDAQLQAFFEEVDRERDRVGGVAAWLLEMTVEPYTARIEAGHGDWLLGDAQLEVGRLNQRQSTAILATDAEMAEFGRKEA